MDKWVAILGAAASLLGFQIYQDIRESWKEHKRKPKTIKICLTGGPCGGKTQGVIEVYRLFHQKNIPAYIVPEVATILGSGGGLAKFEEFSQNQRVMFQITLMKAQIGLENVMSGISNIRCASIPIVLCDRGLLDGKAYLAPERWNKLLEICKIPESEMIKRYELVVHMVTTADEAPEFFENTNIRRQSVEQALQIDYKLKEAWQAHPNRLVVENQFLKTFAEKKAVLVAFISKQIISRYGNQTLLRKPTKIVDEIDYLKRKLKLKQKIQEKNLRKMSG